jgi:hypothetical protein
MAEVLLRSRYVIRIMKTYRRFQALCLQGAIPS